MTPEPCAYCEEMAERIAWLESELGLRTDIQAFSALKRAISAVWKHNGAGGPTRLVQALYAAHGKPMTKLQLMEAVPGRDHAEDSRDPKIIDVWVCVARKALGKAAIETIWGKGYRLTPAGMAHVAEILTPRAEAA